MSYVQLRKRYPFDSIKFDIEKLEESTKDRIFEFEISSLKNNEKFNKTLESLNQNKETLHTYGSKIRGFNAWAGFIVLSLTHYLMLVQKKKLFYELERPHMYYHVGIVLGAGVVAGIFFGNTTSYSYSLYRQYSKTNKKLNYLIDDFSRTYNPQHVMKATH